MLPQGQPATERNSYRPRSVDFLFCFFLNFLLISTIAHAGENCRSTNVDYIEKSVVRVVSVRLFGNSKTGTGIVIDRGSGLILTSAHVLNGACGVYIDSSINNVVEATIASGIVVRTGAFGETDAKLPTVLSCQQDSSEASTFVKSVDKDLALVKVKPSLLNDRCEANLLPNAQGYSNHTVSVYGFFSLDTPGINVRDLYRITSGYNEYTSEKIVLTRTAIPLADLPIDQDGSLALDGRLSIQVSSYKIIRLDGFSGGPIVGNRNELIALSSYSFSRLNESALRSCNQGNCGDWIEQVATIVTEEDVKQMEFMLDG